MNILKKSKKIILAISLLSTSTLAFAQQSISFGTNATYPPFISKNAQGQFIGFDIDLINAICQKLQAKCTVTDTSFESLVPSVLNNKYDAVFGGITVTKKRAKVIAFTQIYKQNPTTYIVEKNKPLLLTKQGLKGEVIGYQQGNMFQDYLKATYGNSVTIKSYPSDGLAMVDLRAGRINAIMVDKLVGQSLLKETKDDNLTLQGNIYSDKYFGKGVGIGLKKGNTKLLNQLNKAIDQLRQDGTLAKLDKKWFS